MAIVRMREIAEAYLDDTNLNLLADICFGDFFILARSIDKISQALYFIGSSNNLTKISYSGLLSVYPLT